MASSQGPNDLPRLTRDNLSDEQIQWLSQAWAQKNPSYDLPGYRRARLSLWNKLQDVKFLIGSSELIYLSYQNSYQEITSTWRFKPLEERAVRPPLAAHLEAVRLMNDLHMPENIVTLLAHAGFDADKCCDPTLNSGQKKLAPKPVKRSAATQQLEEPEAKRPKTASENTAGNNTLALPPTNPATLRNTQSQTSAPPTKIVFKASASTKTATQTPAEAPPRNFNGFNSSKLANADAQAVPTISRQNSNKSIIVSTSECTNTLVDVPQAAPAAGAPVQVLNMDSNAGTRNAFSMDTAEFSAAVAAQLHRQDEVRQKQHEEMKKQIEEQKKQNEEEKKQIEEQKKQIEAQKKQIEEKYKALEAAQHFARGMTASFRELERRLGGANEQAIKKE